MASNIKISHQSVNIAANRAKHNYTRREQFLRVAWVFGSWLINFSPRPAFAWRRLILGLFGANIGKEVHIYPSTIIYMPWNVEIGDWSALGDDVLLYSLDKICIGKNVTISYRSHLCAGTHDLNHPELPLLKLPITIEDDAWIGTEAFIGPGTVVGSMAVVGARAVVVKNVEAQTIMAGNPARVVGHRTIAATMTPG